MPALVDRCTKIIDSFIQSGLSVVKIILYSKFRKSGNIDYRNKNEVVLLANGPSLNTTISESMPFLRDKTLLALNFFIDSVSFQQLKPQIYVIADPFFWTNPVQMKRFFGDISLKTTWDLDLYVPCQAFRVDKWKVLVESNANIHLRPYNATPLEGFQSFCNFAFKNGLGVPRPHNVLIPSLIVALNQEFRTVYVAGADHSWLSEISVDDDNRLLMNQKHFYDQGVSKSETVKRRDFSEAHLHDTLYHMYVAFKSYFVIRKYAESIGKQIYNITPYSFIDAFDRLKIS